MRLIDADALKEEVNKKKVVGRFNTLLLIDNAPTVNIIQFKDWYLVNKAGAKELLDRERPQGEWILNKDENPECPFCHSSFTYWGNFCSNCGADMQKGYKQ